MSTGLRTNDDGVTRCFWCGDDLRYVAYHDEEWGFPVDDDVHLFEKLCLEGFQAGLSWITILRKRENFRAAFGGFDIETVAKFNKRDVNRLLRDAGIVRHRGKIESAINNAQRTIELIDECGSLAAYIWRFEPRTEDRPTRLDYRTLMALTKTAESAALSKDLRTRGFRFVGPTTAYAFMQSVGLVNDHIEGCAIRPRVDTAHQAFVRPCEDHRRRDGGDE
jgi:DNA-3-methyladenine glycosylase I